MLSRRKLLTLATMAPAAALLKPMEALANRTVYGRTFTTPIVMRGFGAPLRAGQHAARQGLRLPTPQELQVASPILAQFPEFNKPGFVFFTSLTGIEWDIVNNKSHHDQGWYIGFDLVTCTNL